MRSSVPAALLIGVALAVPTQAQMMRIVPSNLMGGDKFAHSVCVDGGFVMAGSWLDDNKGNSDAGSAYLFQAPIGSGSIGFELGRFTAANGQPNDHFGKSVSLQGGFALVGAPGSDALAGDAGCAYLFDADPALPGFGTQLMWFLPAGGGASDMIGWTVALDAGFALVGAPGDDDQGSDAGAAYLFGADPGSPSFGQQLLKLTASDGAANDALGTCVSMRDGMALVGAPGATIGGAAGSGAAYMFDVDPTSPSFGNQQAKLAQSNSHPNDKFGMGVALSDGLALVGAPGRERPGMQQTQDEGAAYLFGADPSSSQFATLLTRLQPSTIRPRQMSLGHSVALDGGIAVVGSHRTDVWTGSGNPPNDWKAGAAYVFDVLPSSPFFGGQLTKLNATNTGQFFHFGWAVSVQSGVIAVGSPAELKQGAMYVTRMASRR